MTVLTSKLTYIVIVTTQTIGNEVITDIHKSFNIETTNIADFYQELRVCQKMCDKVEVYEWTSPTLIDNGKIGTEDSFQGGNFTKL